MATQDTVTQLIAAIRRVRREVPGAAGLIAAACTAHDYDDPGKPAIAWDDADARAALVDALVGDAHRVLAGAADFELGPAGAEAVALLALIAGQDVEPVEGSDGTDGRWRIAERVATDRVISVVDPEARHAHKTVQRRQDGFKAHLAVEPDTGIITDCALTKASGPGSSDATVGVELLDRRARAGSRCSATPPTALVMPAPARRGRSHRGDQADPAARRQCPAGSPSTTSRIDIEDAGTVTCPNGHAPARSPRRNRHLRRGLPRLPAAHPVHHQQEPAEACIVHRA